MSGKGITDLRQPKKRNSPVGKHGFESKRKAKVEDRARARLLRNTAAKFPDWAAPMLLASRLDSNAARRRQSLASSRYMRKHRIRITGELWRLYKVYKHQPRTFTLMPAGLTFAPDQLAGVDPRKLVAQVRADLNRAGASSVDGFLFICLDGEHDQLTDLFQIHFHGIAHGGMLDVVNRLRKQRRYRRQPVSPGSSGKTSPARIDRRPLKKLPKPLSYIVKSYWPSRARGRGDAGTRGKPRTRRIPEPAHSQWLLWIDQWQLKDVVLLVKLRVMNGRLEPR